MDDKKVRQFIELSGRKPGEGDLASLEERKLAAQLILSETLEYVIDGLGVIPSVGNVAIEEANCLSYEGAEKEADREEMLDGLADVAYTMFWNAAMFNLSLEKAFSRICDNNLEKFVKLQADALPEGELAREDWDCRLGVFWSDSVVKVEVVKHNGTLYAVGRDINGKVQKPSTYEAVDLKDLL